jgi:hypothetical protein
MSQKNLLVNGLKVEYNGLFQFTNFMRTLNKNIEKRGYKRHEKRFEEVVGEKGKDLFIELRPIKMKTAWASLTIKIRITMKNVREVLLDVDGIETPFQQGDVHILFDAWVTYLLNRRWGMNPVFWFVKSVINKYVYKFPMDAGFSGEVVGDTHFLHQHMKSHLNLYKYKAKEAVKVE